MRISNTISYFSKNNLGWSRNSCVNSKENRELTNPLESVTNPLKTLRK